MQYDQFNPNLSVPEIVVYEHKNFEGRYFRTNMLMVNNIGFYTKINFPVGVTTTVFGGNPPTASSQLNFDTWNMNDKVSSIIVVSGIWQFYWDVDFQHALGPQLKPGYYPWVGDVDIVNDKISSFQCIQQTKL